MASLNPLCLMVKVFMGSFSIAIISLTLAVCEAKHLKVLSQTSLNTKPYHNSLNTPILNSTNGNEFFPPSYNLSIQNSINAIFESSKVFDKNGSLSRDINNPDKNLQSAIASCRELLYLASYNLNISLPTRASTPTRETLLDFKTYLCGTLAYIDTCLGAFEDGPEKARNVVIASLDSSRKNVSNSISILSTMDNHDPKGRKLRNAWPPSWMPSEERKLLFNSIKATTANVVVAKDGSGNFKTISEAIASAPQKSLSRFVIYVKQGKYFENVKIDESKWNIVMFGDGMYKTIVSGMRSHGSGSTTVDSATFAVHGQGFIARDMGFENTAGPSANQAVALLSTSDKSIFYKCSITGYQDTLFSVSGRQFYRECQISGTIDLIFGYSSAAVQYCTILVRKPLHGQFNTITAQGRSDPSCPSGFSIHKSNVKAGENLAGARTFLGRPWRAYATAVFVESSLGGVIDPLGWSGWQLGETLPDTVYYGEYGNKDITGRAKGKGVRANMSFAEAEKFTVREFIGGDKWLPATGVPYQAGL